MYDKTDLIETGKNLKRIRQKLKLTQSDIGGKIGTSAATISNLETGSIDIKNAKKFFIALQFTFPEFKIIAVKSKKRDYNASIEFECFQEDINTAFWRAKNYNPEYSLNGLVYKIVTKVIYNDKLFNKVMEKDGLKKSIEEKIRG